VIGDLLFLIIPTREILYHDYNFRVQRDY